MLKKLMRLRDRLRQRMTMVISLICIAVAMPINAASEKQILTLQAAVEKTLRQNPQLHQFAFTQQRLMAMRETSALKPGYSLDVRLEDFAGSGETKGIDSAELTVALSSVIELGDKPQSRISVIDASLDKFELEKQAQTLDVLGSVTSAFVLLLTTQEEIKLSAEAVTLSEALYKTVKERTKRGAASDAEAMRAKALLTQSRIQQDNFQMKLERQKVSLAKYWSETTVEFSELSGDLFSFGQSQRFTELYEKVKQSPAMMVFASEMRLKEASVRLAETQNRADLGWQFGVRHIEASGDNAFTVGLSIPLFNESRNRGSVNAARAEQSAVAYQSTNRMLMLHDQLFSAYSQRQQFIKAHQQLRSQVIPNLEEALDITRDAYNRGRLKYQDWIAAQQELLNAKQQMIKTASAALLNQAVIEQLTAEPLTN
ncbi:Heavy metal RND efflux outer membrane protein, CzcC family [hydrothermal vent metagenome]|uniref:Heavy metal RND efflux outer membrane protein, CzcC family n=1 Tax=hydrothermal vent metagenome TaxID=652676 RepID=A0A3B0X4L7_9ZZZZ